MEINEFQKANVLRTESPDGFDHKLHDWTLQEWACALAGETGELCNIAKKVRRGDYEPPDGMAIAREEIGKEAADVIIYALLILSHLDLKAETVLREKFDEVSKRVGYPHKLDDLFVHERQDTEWQDR